MDEDSLKAFAAILGWGALCALGWSAFFVWLFW